MERCLSTGDNGRECLCCVCICNNYIQNYLYTTKTASVYFGHLKKVIFFVLMKIKLFHWLILSSLVCWDCKWYFRNKVSSNFQKSCPGRVRKWKLISKFSETQYISWSYTFRLLLKSGLVSVLGISIFVGKRGSRNLPRNRKLMKNLF